MFFSETNLCKPFSRAQGLLVEDRMAVCEFGMAGPHFEINGKRQCLVLLWVWVKKALPDPSEDPKSLSNRLS